MFTRLRSQIGGRSSAHHPLIIRPSSGLPGAAGIQRFVEGLALAGKLELAVSGLRAIIRSSRPVMSRPGGGSFSCLAATATRSATGLARSTAVTAAVRKVSRLCSTFSNSSAWCVPAARDDEPPAARARPPARDGKSRAAPDWPIPPPPTASRSFRGLPPTGCGELAETGG